MLVLISLLLIVSLSNIVIVIVITVIIIFIIIINIIIISACFLLTFFVLPTFCFFFLNFHHWILTDIHVRFSSDIVIKIVFVSSLCFQNFGFNCFKSLHGNPAQISCLTIWNIDPMRRYLCKKILKYLCPFFVAVDFQIPMLANQ